MSSTTTTDCPICMEVVESNINCVITECGHTFHTRCLLTNIVHNGFGCPYCRTKMVTEELLRDDDEEENDEMNQAFIIEDDEDEEGRENGRNWLTAEIDNRVTIRRDRMNRLRMYERSHSAMRLMFARLEDDADAEPDDVDFEDYSTIASDNYSFDEEDYTDSDSESNSENNSEDDSGENGVVDEEAEEASRAFANHLPNVNELAYSLERAEYTTADFVRILLHNEYLQYSSIINGRRADSTHRTVNRLISRIISVYQERIHPIDTSFNVDTSSEVPDSEQEDPTISSSSEDEDEETEVSTFYNTNQELQMIDMDYRRVYQTIQEVSLDLD